MPGNSKRRGAVRKPGTKKGATVGSGGQRRRGLEGKGPTPKASERTGHPAQRKAAAAERRANARPGGGKSRPGSTRASGTEVIGGRNSVLEALRARVPATTLYVASRIDADDRVREILRIATGRGMPLIETTKTDLDKIADGAVHQGVALAIPPYTYAEPGALLEAADGVGEPALIIALDGVTDPRNLGAVLRSAGAFGAHGVLVPERRSAGVTAAAWKTSAGAAARVPVARATNLVRALQDLQKAGCFVVGLDGDGPAVVGDLPVADGPVVLVIGSEGKGLSRLVRSTCDVVAAIPIASSVESLNASVAASIALYEVARRRG